MSVPPEERKPNLFVRMFGRRDLTGEVMRVVDVPEDALTPREKRLLRVGRILSMSAWLHAALAVGMVMGSVLAWRMGLSLSPLRRVLMMRVGGTDGAALTFVLVLLAMQVSLSLVGMVSVMAREVWGLVLVIGAALGHVVLGVVYGYTPALLSVIFWTWAAAIALQDPRAFRLNPVMMKELRGQMRGMRAFVVMTVYLVLMSGALLFLYTSQLSFGVTYTSAAGTVGRSLFSGVVVLQMMLVIFIAPAFTSGAITGERERQTYDLLRTTLLASPSFVMGKLESALSYVLLLLMAAIPLQSIAFLFGGVSQTELLVAFVMLSVLAIGLGTVGLFFSAIAPRTLAASTRTYVVTVVGAFIGPGVLELVIRGLRSVTRFQTPGYDLLLTYMQQAIISLNPISAAVSSQTLLIERQQLLFTTETLRNNTQITLVSPWISFVLIYLALAAVMLALTVREVRKVPV